MGCSNVEVDVRVLLRTLIVGTAEARYGVREFQRTSSRRVHIDPAVCPLFRPDEEVRRIPSAAHRIDRHQRVDLMAFLRQLAGHFDGRVTTVAVAN